MPPALALAAPAVLGGVSGALSGQKTGGQDAGNIFNNPNTVNTNALQQEAGNASNMANNVLSADPTSLVSSNPMMQGLFGTYNSSTGQASGGALNNALSEQQNLQNNGFNLTNSDQTAYGQGAAQIANQFGQSNQSLSQSLASRGLSNSGAAGSAFTTAAGSQNEQLAGLQTQIAQQRMNFNQQMMNQNQNFISQLGGLQNQAINNQANQDTSRAQGYLNSGNQAEGYLGQIQGQNNDALGQRQQTAQASPLSGALSGLSAGLGAGMSSMSGSGSKTPGTTPATK